MILPPFSIPDFHRKKNLLEKISFSKARQGNPKKIIVFDDFIQVDSLSKITASAYLHENTLVETLSQGIERLSLDTKSVQFSLILPPSFFQFVPFELPGMKADGLREALLLQADGFFPGHGEENLLAYMNFDYSGQHGCSFWMKSRLADDIFDICFQHNILLTEIIPRPFSLSVPGCNHYCIDDLDGYQNTFVEIRNGTPVNWVCISGSDRDNVTFMEEYTRERQLILEQEDAEISKVITISESSIPAIQMAKRERVNVYFQPGKFSVYTDKKRKNNLFTVTGIISLFIVFFLFLPFGRLYFKKKEIKQRVASLTTANGNTIRLSQKIQDFNAKWGMIEEFPHIDMPSLLTTLNTIIPVDSWLVSLSMDNGLLEVSGYSPNPEQILVALSGERIFEDVAYSQAVRVDKTEKHTIHYFAIQCKIRNMDISEYLAKYFDNNQEY